MHKETRHTISLSERQMEEGGLSFGNRNCLTLRDSDRVYQNAQAMFSDHYVEFLPVIDEERNLLGIMTRNRAFYRECFVTENLPHMWYGKGVDDTVRLAKLFGIKRISVLEFGMAAGAGLMNLEFHAREQERLSGVRIDVLGFDSGMGLIFNEEDTCNIAWRFGAGDYSSDENELLPLLRKAKMVYGDICETAEAFFEDKEYAPIGFVSIDVDNYTPAAAIPGMLGNSDDSRFLPRVRLYLDDLLSDMEFQGKAVAV